MRHVPPPSQLTPHKHTPPSPCCCRVEVPVPIGQVENDNTSGLPTLPTPLYQDTRILDLHHHLLNTSGGIQGTLSRHELLAIAEAARFIVGEHYVHLDFKMANHAVNPVQAINLIIQRLVFTQGYGSDLEFHTDLQNAFLELQDDHTAYVLPSPYLQLFVCLPFFMSRYQEGGVDKYLVSKVDVNHSTFVRGVEILEWNTAPISHAVAQFAERFKRGNSPSSLAQAVRYITNRRLARYVWAVPRERAVLVTYRTLAGAVQDIWVRWVLYQDQAGSSAQRQFYDFAFEEYPIGAVDVISRNASLDTVLGTVETEYGRYGYLKINSFSPPLSSESFGVERTVAGIGRSLLDPRFPKNGAMIDLRGNRGGAGRIGYELLQYFTRNRIEVVHVSYRTTDAMRELSAIQHSNCQARTAGCASPRLADVYDSMVGSIQTGERYSASVPIDSSHLPNCAGQIYQGPVVLLVSGRIYSASDWLTTMFRDNGVGKIIGEDDNIGAGGSSIMLYSQLSQLYVDERGEPLPSSPYNFSLPGDALIGFGIMRGLRPLQGYSYIEDIGLRPDLVIPPTKSDLLNGSIDFFASAAYTLSQQPTYHLDFSLLLLGNGSVAVELKVASHNIDRLEVFFVYARRELTYLDHYEFYSEAILSVPVGMNQTNITVGPDLIPGETESFLAERRVLRVSKEAAGSEGEGIAVGQGTLVAVELLGFRGQEYVAKRRRYFGWYQAQVCSVAL